LSAIPLASGAFRLVGLAGGPELMPANARFAASPLPVVLHIVSVSIFAILGAFQFSTGLRRRKPGWHRAAGRLVVACGLLVGLSGLWLTLFYSHPDGSQPLLYALRLLFGSAMVVSILLGFAAILRRDVNRHRAWMTRGYAIGLGAGTQALTLLVGEVILGPPTELSRALLMGAAWVINLAVAEWVIRKRPSPITVVCHFGNSSCHSPTRRSMVWTRLTQEFWDARYSSAERIWSGNPNPHLVAQVADLAPGSALDVGSGEGADAIWLATRGWQVTGIDLSTVALERAAQLAARAGQDIAERITWEQADVLSWDPAPRQFDLVSAQFMHLPRLAREALHRRLAAAVRPGGMLLIVGHHPADLDTSMGRPNLPDFFFTADELVAALSPGEWGSIVAAAPERQAVDPEGRALTIRDAILCADLVSNALPFRRVEMPQRP
jgi:SAM-dependent methyltransferase/uncharacterized membrane protein